MPILYIMSGVGFSGKSTLAKKISEHTGAVLVSQDAMYFEKKDELNLDGDDETQWKMLLAMCRERILKKLSQGHSVVFDNINTKFIHREELRELAHKAHAESKVIFLNTPIEIQKERQKTNKETAERHDVKQEYLDQAIKELEIPGEQENTLVFKPDMNIDSFLENL